MFTDTILSISLNPDMTTEEFVIKLKGFNDTFPEVRDKLIMDAVFSINAIAKRRVIDSRTSSEGTIFGLYSKDYLKKRIKKGKGSDPRINFSFTGKMWQSTQPVIRSSTPDEVRIHIAPLDSQRNKVMGYHDKKYGEIIAISEKEIEELTQDFANGVQDHMTKLFS